MDKNILETLRARGNHSVEMRQALIAQEDKQIRDIIVFATALMSILGVVAGFGFTALQFVQTPFIFFLGETLMLGSIFYLGFKLKGILVDWTIPTTNLIHDFADDSAKIKKAFLEKNDEEMERLANEFQAAVQDTSTPARVFRGKTVDQILTHSFLVALLGISLVLISFTSICVHKIQILHF